MKKYIYLISVFVLFSASWVQAKKVKFAVDMSGQTIMSTGVHVTGNFQALAGFPGGDWQSNTTRCLQEGSTDIYSVVVDIPANRVYQYKFVNGDQFYEVEFVPEESRVNYEFIDNRWIYVDSTSADTFTFPVILFGGNAPAGKKLCRLSVDAKELVNVASSGIYVWSNASPNLIKMDNIHQKFYDVLLYVDSAFLHEYRFVNGTNYDSVEVVPTACSNGFNRSILVDAHKQATSVCFGSCEPCTAAGLNAFKHENTYTIFPNPAKDKLTLEFELPLKVLSVTITDLMGKIVLSKSNNTTDKILELDTQKLMSGFYILTCTFSNQEQFSKPLIIE
ncbi:MAG: T9SS type A sorting domain-containing protein [Bacteroidia bacterium]|nr:T9SS type A sorting domain-containing protein [Bacteroidia bacterium]